MDDEIDQLNKNLNEMLKKIFPDAHVKASVFPAREGIGIKIDMGKAPAHVDFNKLQEVLRQYIGQNIPQATFQVSEAEDAAAKSGLEIIDAEDRYYITREVDIEAGDVERIDIGSNAVTIYKKDGSYAGFGLPDLDPINPISLKYTLKERVLDIEVVKKK